MRITITAIGLVLAVSPAYAATYYVAPTGSDTNAGTSAAPFRTITKASTVAQPGDVIRLKNGTYSDAASAKRFSASGTSTNPITLTSDTRLGAKITVHGLWVDGAYVITKEFEINAAGFPAAENTGLYLTGTGDQAIGNWVHDLNTCSTNGSAGILLDGYYGGSVMTVDGNRVDRVGVSCTGGLWHGIYIGAVGSTVQNNIVTGIPHGGALHVWHDGREVKMRANTLVGNATGVITGCGDVYLLTCASGSGNNQITGNIMVNNTNNFNESGTAATPNRYDRNLEWGQGTRVSSSNGQLTTAMLGNPILADPMFVSATDFHLKTGSPAIGAAIQPDSPSKDFDGVARPQATSYDVGAYEYVSPPPPPPQTVTCNWPSGSASAPAGSPVQLSVSVACQ